MFIQSIFLYAKPVVATKLFQEGYFCSRGQVFIENLISQEDYPMSFRKQGGKETFRVEHDHEWCKLHAAWGIFVKGPNSQIGVPSEAFPKTKRWGPEQSGEQYDFF